MGGKASQEFLELSPLLKFLVAVSMDEEILAGLHCTGALCMVNPKHWFIFPMFP